VLKFKYQPGHLKVHLQWDNFIFYFATM